jgi:hypothetical protein
MRFAATVLAALFLSALALPAVRPGLAAPDQPPTVPGKLYEVVWVDSALDLTHGGGQRTWELYLPDLGLAATFHEELVPGQELTTGEPPLPHFRLVVTRADAPRNTLTGLHGTPSAIRDVEVPRALADEIAEFARLTERFRKEGLRLGDDAHERLELASPEAH